MKNAMPEKIAGGRSALCNSEIAKRRLNRVAFTRFHSELRNYTVIKDQACGKGTPRVLARLSLRSNKFPWNLSDDYRKKDGI